MEKKTRGKIKIDIEKTPIENITSILAQTYPTELAVAKLGENFTKNGKINFNGISIYATDSNKQETGDKNFARIAFETRANHVLRHRNRRCISIYIRNQKVSISDVIWAVTTCTETKQANNEIKAKKEEEQAAERAAEAAREKELSDLHEMSHLSENVGISGNWWEKEKFDIGIKKLTKEQVIAIGKAIYNAGIIL